MTAVQSRVAARALALGVLTWALCISPAFAQSPNFLTGFSDDQGAITSASSQRPEALKEVTFQQRLAHPLPLDTPFKDEGGRDVKLGDFFRGDKPVILAFVYYKCPMLCIQVMNGISASLRALSFEAGKDYEVVLVSFDSRDTPADAAAKERTHLEYWKEEDTAGAWHLLTGSEANIRRVTDAAGFTYKWDEPTQQFAHVSGVLVVTPEGLLSRYFYGIEYSPRELRLALVESGQGHIGTAIDELMLYCFEYDPLSGRYGVVVRNLLRLGGVLTIALILGIMLFSKRADASRTPRLDAPATAGPGAQRGGGA